jgi:membrane protease YdiL (CAAX protease family)
MPMSGIIDGVDNVADFSPLRPGPLFLAAVVGFLGGQVLAGLLEGVGVAITHFPGGLHRLAALSNPPWWATALGIVGLWIGFAGIIWFAQQRGGLPTSSATWRVRASDLSMVGLGVLAQLAVDAAYALAHVGHLNAPVQRIFGEAHGASFVLMGLITVVGSPVMEEWLFRGVIFRGLRASMTGRYAPVIAAAVSAALFALAHGEARQFAGLFALGLVLAEVYRRTERLSACVAVHLGFNALAYGVLVVQRAHG